jgi:hypothetical protein
MAWSAADLATLEAAIASGTLSVRFSDGRQVTYQSTEAMLRVRAIIRAETASTTDPTQTPGAVSYLAFDRD